MDDLETIRARVRALTPRERDELSRRSDVPRSTLDKFAHGHVAMPGYETVRALVLAMQTSTSEAA